MTDSARTVIRVDLEIRRPWAIGGLSTTGDEINLPVLTDPRTDCRTPYLPATSLAGSLRRHLGNQGVDWLGSPDSTSLQSATPSPLRCLGAQLAGAADVSIRRTTAIDGHRQAARTNYLRAEELVDASDATPTVLQWWLQLDGSSDKLEGLHQALWSWEPFIGRRRSVGQGDATVTGVSCATINLSKPEHLHWWLTDRTQWDGLSEDHSPPGWAPVDRDGTTNRTQGRQSQPITATFAVQEPLFVGSDLSVTSAGGRGETKVTQRCVPGSSWKGLFRNRVTHVLTVCGYAESGEADAIVEDMFGSARETGKSEGAGVRGKLLFRTTDLSSGLTVTRTHVAIDRITGGARDRGFDANEVNRGGSLFSVEAIAPGTSVALTIDTIGELSDLERLLLEHVVHDISTGLVGVGGLTSRGYGTLAKDKPGRVPAPIPRPGAPAIGEEA